MRGFLAVNEKDLLTPLFQPATCLKSTESKMSHIKASQTSDMEGTVKG